MAKQGGHQAGGMSEPITPGTHNPLDPFAPTVKTGGSEKGGAKGKDKDD